MRLTSSSPIIVNDDDPVVLRVAAADNFSLDVSSHVAVRCSLVVNVAVVVLCTDSLPALLK